MAEYVLTGPKWGSNTVTWDFGTGAPFSDVITSQYRATVVAALQEWSRAANITFQQLGDGDASANVQVGFTRLAGGGHAGDVGLTSYRYRGASFVGTVDVQLEDPAERPLVGNGSGYNYQGSVATLYQVALHEVGHALGLGHASDPQAVMYPYASGGNTALSIADIAGIQQLYGAPAGTDIGVTDTALGLNVGLAGAAYGGPVAGLQQEYLYDGSDGVNISASVPGMFLRGGSGADAISVSGGRNVLDGGKSSNFLLGGTGPGSQDTFFVDGRGSAAVWNTIGNFHGGDTATLWGYLPGTTKLAWAEGQGAAGYTGATLHADVYGDGKTFASLTFAGLSVAQAQATVVGSGTAGNVPYLQFAA